LAEPATLLGRRVRRLRPLGGGCLFDVRAAELDDGSRVVVKSGAGGIAGQLELEARMLADLRAAEVAVPEVLAVDAARLVLAWIEHDGGGLDRAGREQLADQLAALHARPHAAFGYDYDTVIGSLPQPNPPAPDWCGFFRDHRLLGPAEAARAEGRLDAAVHRRLEALAARLDELLVEPAHPELLHGDLWAGNVLAKGGRPVAWIDPAIYRGHGEMELAFALLFGPFDRRAVARYAERRPLAPGFEPTRCAIYQLYHLLNHLRLFGRGYLGAIANRLEVLGL
jgi:fructosamine-3-kinase